MGLVDMRVLGALDIETAPRGAACVCVIFVTNADPLDRKSPESHVSLVPGTGTGITGHVTLKREIADDPGSNLDETIQSSALSCCIRLCFCSRLFHPCRRHPSHCPVLCRMNPSWPELIESRPSVLLSNLTHFFLLFVQFHCYFHTSPNLSPLARIHTLWSDPKEP